MCDKIKTGHSLAYLIWDTDNIDDLNYLKDVFNSCIKIREEQFRVRTAIGVLE